MEVVKFLSPEERIARMIQDRSVRVVPEGSEFKLSSGRMSRIFCDLKKTALCGDAGEDLSLLLTSRARLHFKEVDAFAGVALGGCHLASIAAFRAGVDCLHVRKEAKDHGTKSLVESPDFDRPTTRVVLLEDVCTTSKSAAMALANLREGGYNVVGILAVVDRRVSFESGPGGPDEVGGVPFRAVYRLHDLLPEEHRGLV